MTTRETTSTSTNTNVSNTTNTMANNNSETVYNIESHCNTNSKNGYKRGNVVNQIHQNRNIINNSKKSNYRRYHHGHFPSIEECEENNLTPKTPEQNDTFKYASLSDDEGYAHLADTVSKRNCIVKKSICVVDDQLGSKKSLHRKGFDAIVSATVMVKSNLNPFKKVAEEDGYGNKSKKSNKYGFLKRTSLEVNKSSKSCSNNALRHSDAGGVSATSKGSSQFPKLFTKLCIHVPDTAIKY